MLTFLTRDVDVAMLEGIVHVLVLVRTLLTCGTYLLHSPCARRYEISNADLDSVDQ